MFGFVALVRCVTSHSGARGPIRLRRFSHNSLCLRNSLFHSLSAGAFWGRRACPPTVRAATVMLGRRARLVRGADLASAFRPGTSRRTLQNRLFGQEPDQPNQANHGDDYENIHGITFYLSAVLVTWPLAWRAGSLSSTGRFQPVARPRPAGGVGSPLRFWPRC